MSKFYIVMIKLIVIIVVAICALALIFTLAYYGTETNYKSPLATPPPCTVISEQMCI